jgi:hypothetical protein
MTDLKLERRPTDYSEQFMPLINGLSVGGDV